MSILFSHFFTKINQISPLEHEFTEVLSSIALTPKTLYFYGKLPKNVSKSRQSTRPKAVAIVGSRHNTRYGQEVAYKMAYELAKRGVIIISGLAYGIDSIAHQACLDAGGCTIAVLGTPIDHIYPRNHLSLAREILEKDGAILSEYAPRDAQDALIAPGEAVFDGKLWHDYNEPLPSSVVKRNLDMKTSFLYRNRLISGLADIVVVVEAATKSGTLNTATHAIEQGKDVYAVPGNITSPYSQGCNRLIKQGAIPYTEPEDLLRELFPEDCAKKQRKLRQAQLFGDTDAETLILQVIAAGIRSGEEIMQATKLPPEVFNQTITLLEIKSRLRSLGANNWGLA